MVTITPQQLMQVLKQFHLRVLPKQTLTQKGQPLPFYVEPLQERRPQCQQPYSFRQTQVQPGLTMARHLVQLQLRETLLYFKFTLRTFQLRVQLRRHLQRVQRKQFR